MGSLLWVDLTAPRPVVRNRQIRKLTPFTAEVKCLPQIWHLSVSASKRKIADSSQTREVGMMKRRELMRMLAIAGVGSSVSTLRDCLVSRAIAAG